MSLHKSACRIFLTGAAGFIGSHVSQALLEQGNEVLGIDDLNDYYNPAWKKENLAKLENFTNFTFEKIDIRRQEAVEASLSKFQPQVVVHLAARAGVRASIKEPVLYQSTNVGGTLHILEAIRKAQVKTSHPIKLVFASSSSVYGNQKKVPFSETDPCNHPISPYAATKKAGEMLCHTYAKLYQIPTVALRFFTVYGPAGRPDMAPWLFTEAILKDQVIKQFGSGESRRDYTYIDDIVKGVVAATELERRWEVINLGNNQPVSLVDFIKTLEKVIGRKAQIKQVVMPPGDVQQTYAQIDKARELLGFEPSTSLEEGLQKFVEWFQEVRV